MNAARPGGQDGPGVPFASVHVRRSARWTAAVFTPSAEGLEGRAHDRVSSAADRTIEHEHLGPGPAEDLPRNRLRIDHLPLLSPVRKTPAANLPPGRRSRKLQTDINAVISELTLRRPGGRHFNAGLRDLMPYNTLSRQNARQVNNAFGAVLDRAGATPEQRRTSRTT